jgi:hypothetical protein
VSDYLDHKKMVLLYEGNKKTWRLYSVKSHQYHYHLHEKESPLAITRDINWQLGVLS